jgi:glucose/arabinose dehydrogenase
MPHLRAHVLFAGCLLLAVLLPAQMSVAEPGAARANGLTFPQFKAGFNNPIFLTHAGDSRLFVVEQGGRIRIIKDGNTLATPFLDINDKLISGAGERGLLGLAFEPDYATTGRFYVQYTGKPDGRIVIERYERDSANADLANADSAQIVLTYTHSTRGNTNHNAGWIGFGPDGYLYLTAGDGGGGGDPECTAQNVADLRGKMLRINVVGQVTYTVPASNTFKLGQRPEVFAIGLRNPWRASFDRLTGDLYIGDVGQGTREEVSLIPAGSDAGMNFGWPSWEGRIPHPTICMWSGRTLVPPLLDYNRSQGSSITGGYVYRGLAHPALVGAYFHGDYVSGNLWYTKRTGQQPAVPLLAMQMGFNISSFGEDVNGELYVIDYGGKIHRIVNDGSPLPDPIRVFLPAVAR